MNTNLKIQSISIEWLREQGACNLDNEWYAQHIIGEVPITAELILAAHQAGVLNTDWLADRILTAQALAEYERVTAQALAEYERVTAQAWAEYGRVKAQVLAEYERVTAQALAEYGRVTAQALAEYERVTAQAWAEYGRVTAPALAHIVELALAF